MSLTASSKQTLVGGLIGVAATLLFIGFGLTGFDRAYAFVSRHVSSVVQDAPITEPGFRILLVYEIDKLAKYPAKQTAIFTDPQIATYARAKCVKGAGGNAPEYRCFDANDSMEHQTQVWKDAMKLPRQALPWIVVSDGKKGYSGPLPANAADTLALLKKYGGQ